MSQKLSVKRSLSPDEEYLVANVEKYLDSYISFADPIYRLPLALWTLGTFCYPEFDAFPYLVITSSTKRSGKTRLGELLSFACSNARNFAAMTAATLFRSIEAESPTVFFDEAETLSSESANTMRAVLNVGYRKGQTIPRTSGNTIKEYPTFCPKVFILIGDVYDTLRDRSIVVTMRRGEAPQRFIYDVAKGLGAAIAETAAEAIKAHTADIAEVFASHPRLDFLTDRDEEIWTPLFTLAHIFCPDRINELSQCAVDIATEKTAESRRYTQLESEDQSADAEYAEKLLLDLYALLLTHGKIIASREAVDLLKQVPTSPWRKFRGAGLSIRDMANMLSRFGVKPARIAKGSGRGNQTFLRGYKLAEVETAVRGIK
jgi:Protein of unknown function (DUF3631)